MTGAGKWHPFFFFVKHKTSQHCLTFSGTDSFANYETDLGRNADASVKAGDIVKGSEGTPDDSDSNNAVISSKEAADSDNPANPSDVSETLPSCKASSAAGDSVDSSQSMADAKDSSIQRQSRCTPLCGICGSSASAPAIYLIFHFSTSPNFKKSNLDKAFFHLAPVSCDSSPSLRATEGQSLPLCFGPSLTCFTRSRDW